MSPVDTLLNQLRYVNRTRVKADVDAVTQEYRTLIPRIVDFVHDNGSSTKLIVLSGTIPIMYQSVQYNIPVDLFVTIGYPTEAPKLYVRPTSNMTVKANHQHVSPNGLCYLPYLHEWTAPCTLVGLAEIASSVFSIEPPLFSRPTGAAAAQPSPSTAQRPSISTANTNSNPYYTSNSNTGAGTSATPTATATSASAYGSYATATAISAGTAAGATMASPAAHQGYNQPGSAHSSSGNLASYSTTSNTNIASNNTHTSTTAGKPDEQRRLELVDAVTMRMYEVIDNKQRMLRDELDNQMSVSSALSASADNAAKTLKDLKSSVAMYTEAVNTITTLTAAFDSYSEHLASAPPLLPTDRLVPYDPLSQQIVRLNSEIHAIDDAFYYMERALVSNKNDKVDLGTFLKECRQLARKQFLCKAHLRKITAECLQQTAQRTAAQHRGAPIPEQQQQHQHVPPQPPHSNMQQQHINMQQQAQYMPQQAHGQYANAVPVQQGHAGHLNSMNSGISAVPYPGAAVTANRY